MERRLKLASLILCYFILIGLTINVTVALKNKETTSIAINDAYVLSTQPSTNFGSSDRIKVDDANTTFGYLMFNFDNKPSDWKQAEIRLKACGIGGVGSSLIVYVDVNLVNQSWDESTINYNNRPSKGQLIDTFIVNGSLPWVSINVTDYIQDAGTNISIALTGFSTGSYSCEFWSKESIDTEERPSLIWISEGAIPGYNGILLITVLLLIGIVYSFKRLQRESPITVLRLRF
jgi:hypothetical protein